MTITPAARAAAEKEIQGFFACALSPDDYQAGSHVQALLDSELSRLRERVKELERDVGRYQWLRSDGLSRINFEGWTTDTSDVGLDYIIDAATQPRP